MDLNKLKKELYDDAKQFSTRIQFARSVGCVSGAFSDLLGSESISKARNIRGNKGGVDNPRKVTKTLKESFRAGLKEFYDVAKGGKHIIEKPYGYPGDFEILELIYDKCPHPDTRSDAGKYIDVWGLTKSLPCAVSARKDALRIYLENYFSDKNDNKKILSIASGSARELLEMKPEILKNLDITLIDFEQHALNYVGSKFSLLENQPPLSLINGDALRGSDYFDKLEQKAPFEIIYSFGFYDYLPDKYLVKSASKFFDFLDDNGRFIFCLKDERYYDSFIYDWVFDWKFVPRTFDDGLTLAERIGLKVDKTLVVDGRSIVIYICKKLG